MNELEKRYLADIQPKDLPGTWDELAALGKRCLHVHKIADLTFARVCRAMLDGPGSKTQADVAFALDCGLVTVKRALAALRAIQDHEKSPMETNGDHEDAYNEAMRETRKPRSPAKPEPEREEPDKETEKVARHGNTGGQGPTGTGGKRYTQEELDAAAVTALRAGQSQSGLAESLGIGNNSMKLAKAWTRAEVQAELGQHPVRSKSQNFNGKSGTARLRELKAARGSTESERFLELMKVQEIIVRLSAVLQNINVANWPVDEFGETALWTVSDLLDDLISLGVWTDRATSAMQGRLEDADVRAKIAQLRNVNGRTPEEAAIFQKRADKLERQLGLRVSGKAAS